MGNIKTTETYYISDFETTSSKTYEEEGQTRVWLWSVCNQDGEIVKDGSNIDTYMQWLMFEGDSKLVYFHNLAFDGSFIIDWLERNGYEYTKKLTQNHAHHYSMLMSDLGIWYTIKIRLVYRIVKKLVHTTIEIRDSLKICPLKVKVIAKSFGLPMEKEKIDYQDYTINEETLSYVHKDVQIVAHALKFFHQLGFKKLTIGGNAFNDLKDYFNDIYNTTYHKKGKDKVNFFQRVFPDLDIPWLTTWRQAYTGGRSQVNPRYADTIQHNIRRFDINSMYPSIMASSHGEELPYGRPIPITERGQYKFELYHIRCSFHLKEGHLPTLLASKGHTYLKGLDKYYEHQEEPIELYLSNVDFNLFQKHYYIYDFEFLEGWGFHTSTKLFKGWIMKYYELKAEMGRQGNKGLKMVYKLILNNIYGKFGSNHIGRSKIPYLFEEEDRIAYVSGDDEEMTRYYLPVAIAVTSYAHKLIDDAIIETGYDNFIYCDTDSIHTLGTLPESMIDNEKLGLFKLEATEEIGKYIRAKTYCHKDDGCWEITCAGMTEDIKRWLIDTYGDEVIKKFTGGLSVTPEDLEETNTLIKDGWLDEKDLYQPKLLHRQVKGGTILVPTAFTLQKGVILE